MQQKTRKTAKIGVRMTAIAVIGLTYRTSKKRFLFAWDALGILVVYLMATFALYLA